MNLQSIKRVMIRVPNWVGDAVMAQPALRELRRVFANARVTLVAPQWVAGLFDGEGLADDLIATENTGGGVQALGRFVAEVRRLRRERFDAAVLLQNAFGAALRARAAGIRHVAGYPTDGRQLLLTVAVPFEADYKVKHQVRYYLNIASELDRVVTGESRVNLDGAQPRLRVSDDEKARALSLICAAAKKRGGSLDASKPVLAINPGATNSRAKQWLPERFAAAADQITERFGFQTIIIGTAADTGVANEVARLMKTAAVGLAGQTSIAELKSILACSALTVSNDTGAAHVSAALGVPTLVVFGPTEHIATRPLSDAADVVRHEVECSPCMLRDCPIDHRCMTRVEVSQVYDAAERLLLGSRVSHRNA